MIYQWQYILRRDRHTKRPIFNGPTETINAKKPGSWGQASTIGELATSKARFLIDARPPLALGGAAALEYWVRGPERL
jgi:hypothetical protein